MLSGRLIKITALFGVILVAMLLVLPHMINLNKFSKTIIDNIEQKTGFNASMDNKPYIEVSTKVQLVLPNFSINYNEQESSKNVFQADAIIITMSPHNFILGINDFDSIELVNPSIIISYTKNVELISSLKKHFNLDKFIIRNASLFSNSILDTPTYTGVYIESVLDSDITKVKGYFSNNQYTFNLDANFSHESEFVQQKAINLNIYNSDINASLYAKKEQETFLGNIKINVSNPFIIKDYLANVFPFINNTKKEVGRDHIEILADLQYKDNNAELTNLTISSEKIKSKGSVSFSLLEELNLNLNLNFDTIDLNSITTVSEASSVEASQEQIQEEETVVTDNSFMNSDFLTKNLNIQLTGKEIKFANLDLKDFNLNLNLNNQTITNSSVNFNITKGENSSNFNVSNLSLKKVDDINVILGQFSNGGNNINDTLDLFDLKNNFSIEEDSLDYSLNSQIIIAPKEIALFNIVGKVGANEGTFHGSIATRVSDIHNYNIDIKFNGVVLDNFNLPIIKSRLKDLLVGSDRDDYLSKFIWFRTFTSAYTVKFEFTNTQYQNNKIDNLAILCSLTPALMQLRGIVKAPFMDGAFSLNLGALSIKPSVDIKLYGNNLDYDLTTSLFADVLPQSSTSNVANNNEIWSDQKLNIFKINKYNATFDIELKNLKFYNHDIQNVQFTSHTSNDILYIDNLGLDIYDGHIQTAGNISFFSDLLYQFSLSGSNIESKKIFADFCPAINAFEGPFSFSSSFVTEGSSPKELISNLNISSNVASAGMTINGINSDVVVDIALQRNNTPKDKMISAVNDNLNTGATNITGLNGSFKGNKGVIQSNDLTFKSRFNSVVSAFSLDLNTLSLASNSQFFFMPYSGNNPITYNIIVSGDLNNTLNRQVDQTTLIAFLKATYNIVTPEDIAAAAKAQKIQAKKAVQQNQIQDPNNKNYLYYQLLEQENGN